MIRLQIKFKIDPKWEEWTEAINKLATEYSKETKQFLTEEGKKGRKEFREYFKENHNVSGKTYKSWRRGKTRVRSGKLITEIYAYNPVLHLLEDGHLLVLGGPKPPKKKRFVDKNGVTRTKSGHIVGFVRGYKPFEVVSEVVSESYTKNADEFISKLLGMYGL